MGAHECVAVRILGPYQVLQVSATPLWGLVLPLPCDTLTPALKAKPLCSRSWMWTSLAETKDGSALSITLQQPCPPPQVPRRQVNSSTHLFTAWHAVFPHVQTADFTMHTSEQLHLRRNPCPSLSPTQPVTHHQPTSCPDPTVLSSWRWNHTQPVAGCFPVAQPCGSTFAHRSFNS